MISGSRDALTGPLGLGQCAAWNHKLASRKLEGLKPARHLRMNLVECQCRLGCFKFAIDIDHALSKINPHWQCQCPCHSGTSHSVARHRPLRHSEHAHLLSNIEKLILPKMGSVSFSMTQAPGHVM